MASSAAMAGEIPCRRTRGGATALSSHARRGIICWMRPRSLVKTLARIGVGSLFTGAQPDVAAARQGLHLALAVGENP